MDEKSREAREVSLVWAERSLAAEIGCSNWTADQVMRHPKFVGLREDKTPQELRREVPKS
jgi:bifunctional non-homologous end joining protein LigD